MNIVELVMEIFAVRMGKHAWKSKDCVNGYARWMISLVAVIAYACLGAVVFQKLDGSDTAACLRDSLKQALLNKNSSTLNVSSFVDVPFIGGSTNALEDGRPTDCQNNRTFSYYLKFSFNIMFTAGTHMMIDLPTGAKVFSIPFVMAGMLLSAAYLYLCAKHALPFVLQLDTLIFGASSLKCTSSKRKSASIIFFLVAMFATLTVVGGAICKATYGGKWFDLTYYFFLNITFLYADVSKIHAGIGMNVLMLGYQLLVYSAWAVILAYLLSAFRVVPARSFGREANNSFKRNGKYKLPASKERKISVFYINEGFSEKPEKGICPSVSLEQTSYVETISIRNVNTP